MASTYRARSQSDPVQERRKLARTEDADTEAMIRRYMRLADEVLDSKPSGAVTSGERVERHLELPGFCISDEWPKAG